MISTTYPLIKTLQENIKKKKSQESQSGFLKTSLSCNHTLIGLRQKINDY